MLGKPNDSAFADCHRRGGRPFRGDCVLAESATSSPDNPDGSTTTDAAMTNFGSDSGADGGGADDGASETGSASPDASPDASDAASDAEDAADAPDGGEEDAAID